MGFFFSLTLFFLSLAALQALKPGNQEIKLVGILDLAITNYTLRLYEPNFKTGELHNIDLPANLSGINVDTIRLRCGSLQRHGAKIKEFYLDNGVNVHPCIERVIIVRLNLGFKWSSIYYNSYELSGNYQLISPVLGLAAYSVVRSQNFSTIQSELEIQAGKMPITIDFSSTDLVTTKSGLNPSCASFDHQNGEVILSNQTRPNVCVVSKQGHFGLVVESPLMPLKGNVGKWKIAIVSSIGGVLGASLLSLLLIAMFVNAKKARIDELERRAYEVEAFQVSMVGHVSAATTNVTRTAPTMDHYG